MIAIKNLEVLAAYRAGLAAFQLPGVIKRSDHFTKMAGWVPFFHDFDYLLNDPYVSTFVATLLCSVIDDVQRTKGVESLAFIEKAREGLEPGGGTVGAIRLASEISRCTKLPNIVVRLTKDAEAERVKVAVNPDEARESILRGVRVLLVTDHITTGSEALSAADTIQVLGGRVTHVLAYAIRSSRTRWDEFHNRNIAVEYVYDLERDLARAGMHIG